MVSAVQRNVATQPPFMHEFGFLIELDGTMIILSDIQLDPLQVEDAKSVMKDQV